MAGKDVNIDTHIHHRRIRQGKEYIDIIESARGAFDSEIKIEGMQFEAEVLKVLSGPNAEGSSGEGRVTTTFPGIADLEQKDRTKELVRVLARPLQSGLTAIAMPKKIDGKYGATDFLDSIRISSLPEFVAIDTSPQFDNIKVDSKILVQMRTDTFSSPDGHTEGRIISHISPPDILESLAEKPRPPKTVFKPECKGNLGLQGATPKFISLSTDPNPGQQNPIIRKFKTEIKTGIYGNGTPQTKFHFNSAMASAKAKSSHYGVPGPAPNKNNAFIWVGHLRNNGYLDLLDRPISLGRETIIYAPMTLNVEAPIEIKYYFHDRGGFGHAWIHGPDATTTQAIENAGLPGNDFREKIAPAIKDMIRDKRNFILVIPEMSFSKGYGTTWQNTFRVNKMAQGQRVEKDTLNRPYTMRTRIHDTAKSAVKNYLSGLPASNLTTYDPGFFSFEKQTPTSNVLQKTHLRERETVTFDGSYTGGKFGDFHQEVTDVVSSHLGQQASANINHISILADGLGAINLASIVKYMPLSSVHSSAEISFKSVPIDRIDFVENGQDSNGFNFSKTPSHAFYTDYLLQRAEIPTPFEFNYITEAGTQAGREFFKLLGEEVEYNKANKSGASPGSKRFSMRINPQVSTSVINMHTVPSSNDGSTRLKVGYALGARGTKAKSLLVPDNNSSLAPPQNFVPDHAQASTRSPSLGKVQEYIEKQKEAYNNIVSFLEIVKKRDTDYANVCKTYATYCINGIFSNESLHPQFLEYIKNIENWHLYEYLIELEKTTIPQLNNINNLRKILSTKGEGIVDQLKDIKDKNKKEDYFTQKLQPFAAVPSRWWEGSLGIAETNKNYTMLTAAETLRKGYPKAIEHAWYWNNSEGIYQGLNSDAVGVYNIILSSIAKESALTKIQEQIINQIEQLSSQGVVPDPDCPQPLTLRALSAGIPTPKVWNPDSIRVDQLNCANKEIRVVSNYNDLKTMINWQIPLPFIEGPFDTLATNRFSTKVTGLKDAAPSVFQAKEFKYRARGARNTETYRDSPKVWSCISKHLAKAWEAACNISGYVPFRITSGIKGWDKTGPAVAYQSGISVDALGLSINVDPPIAGYSSDGDPVYSVFTGMWTPRFVEAHTEELYELGVLYYDPTPFGKLSDAGSVYADNAYQGFFERERREAQNWYSAEHSYNGPSAEGDPKPDYDKIMDAAGGSPIVPPGANPVLWVLTFCEKSGMKWGNSFFLRKRFRGTKTGTSILGFDFRNDAPIAWSDDERKRIDSIYGITDLVARINAISWPATTIDKHMHFQYYAGSPIIRWEEIQGTS